MIGGEYDNFNPGTLNCRGEAASFDWLPRPLSYIERDIPNSWRKGGDGFCCSTGYEAHCMSESPKTHGRIRDTAWRRY
jgi:hypothetical protein